MWKIVNSGDVDACLGLAGNVNAPGDVLGVLREHESSVVRVGVIQNVGLSEWWLRVLPGDKVEVLEELGGSLRTYPEVLGELAVIGGDVSFLKTLVCNPNLPGGVGHLLVPRIIAEGEGLGVVPIRVLVETLADSGFDNVGVGMPRDWLEQLVVSIFGGESVGG